MVIKSHENYEYCVEAIGGMDLKNLQTINWAHSLTFSLDSPCSNEQLKPPCDTNWVRRFLVHDVFPSTCIESNLRDHYMHIWAQHASLHPRKTWLSIYTTWYRTSFHKKIVPLNKLLDLQPTRLIESSWARKSL